MSIIRTQSLSNGEIMVVEDNISDLIFLSDILTGAGFRVRPASDGELALQSVRLKQPDLLLLDINMSGMSGVELCRNLKADPGTRDFPVIFISAEDEAILKVKAFEAGGIDYITKPFVAAEVLIRIDTHLNMHQLKHRLAVQSEELFAEVEERTAELSESEERFRQVAESMSDWIWEIDEECKYIYVSSKVESLLGYTTEEMLGKKPFDLMSGENAVERRHQFRDICRNMTPIRDIENWNVRKDGEQVCLLTNGVPLFDSTGEFIGYRGVDRDITARKRAEKALLESEAKFSKAFLSIPGAVTISNVDDGRIIDVNEGFKAFFEYDRNEVIGKTSIEMQLWEDDGVRDTNVSLLKKYRRLRNRPIKVRSKYGEMKDCELSMELIEISGEPCILSILRDMTEQLQAEKEKEVLEEQLRQAQKMEAIGILAGGIAHDFNNILGVIYGYTDMAMESSRSGEIPSNEYLAGIKKASERAKDLVQQILTFSRRTEHEKKPLQIKPIIKESLKLLRASIPSTISIKSDITTETGVVLADPTQIHQILMNLSTNAAYAMREGGGTMSIILTEEVVTSDQVEPIDDIPPGDYLKLTISDTGKGIQGEVRDKIFEPYFTTKPLGEGTGLGLSVVHGIIKSHGGSISVKSELGTGTTFTLLLPRHEQSVPDDVNRETAIKRGTGNILFIDDEIEIVKIYENMLTMLGYETTALNNSLDALKVFEERKDYFDLVITDLTMPDLTGIELARKILSIRPDIPILLCTGNRVLIPHEIITDVGIKKIMKKPMTMNDMSKAVKEYITNKSNSSSLG